jgi:hypothetical protein
MVTQTFATDCSETVAHDFLLAGRMLCLRIVSAGERCAHVISLRTGGSSWPLLESVEGTPDDAWPPSPALQSPHVESLPDGRHVALLVGMAGRSHWSLAAELETLASGERLSMDVACRVSAPPKRLGSRYRLGPNVQWDAASSALQTAAGTVFLRADGDSSRLDSTANEIEIGPASLGASQPATVRWKFLLEVS